ncbi:hypothetical protein [Propionicicella superfundia]|uniref:hypothetical protein n=1 Tax=Propionicicella superfundia TaxID=348582 RepID=UPI0003F4AF1F|nr:hypothetical protein [Propionicicella superfundia]
MTEQDIHGLEQSIIAAMAESEQRLSERIADLAHRIDERFDEAEGHTESVKSTGRRLKEVIDGHRHGPVTPERAR